MDADLNPVSDDGGGSGQTAAGDIALMGAKTNELLFAQAVDPTPPNEEAVGLIFDINPLDPAVIAVVGAVVVCLVAATWWCRRKPSKTCQATTTLAAGGSAGTVSAATDRRSSPVVQSRYSTRGHGVSPPGSRRLARRASSPASANRSSRPGKVMILTPQQLALCEVLYDVYNGVVPSRGIESKAVQECDLSPADIRRQFKNIKRARELDRENASSSDNNGSGAPPSSPTPRRAAQSRLTRPSTRRASIAAAAAADTKQQPEAGKQPSSRAKKSSRIPVPSKRAAAAAAAAAATTAPSTKKPPVSPRSTPIKRGAAARPGTVGGRGSPARAAKRAAPSSPSGRSAAASVLPSSPPESPMRTRGRNNRTASVRVGSPKSAPTKRAAAAAAAAASSPRSGGGGTPSKRGKPSVLEIARREAQQQTVDVASTRASSLRARRSSRSNTNNAMRRGTKS
ncbi:expressed unknown protein [Ectocarpus siliculosus]|uniref:Uncharacterized protein n=1 Tax=Ectocarpus siliculosus TaxID=2880 RepID=D7FJR0_ECTSI|nr:expressed unknown protein [Ectocarpus siliculosus]|eukprot:CBJ29162.1 expressed unknown protein [Ectocarpus siliculosus]